MRIVIAPDKFKGCLSALQVAQAIASGIQRVLPQAVLDLCPLADGGEGLVDTFTQARGGKKIKRIVTGPTVSRKVEATFAALDDGVTFVIEMASASGLALLPEPQRNPLRTTTYGTGQLLCHAAAMGARHIIIGLGGSATVDAGIGCAQACGTAFTFKNGTTYSSKDRRLVGADVANILRASPIRHSSSANSDGPGTTNLAIVKQTKRTQLQPTTLLVGCSGSDDIVKQTKRSQLQPGTRTDSPDFSTIQITGACDVGNPLFGDNGAAVVFGAQKGATSEQIAFLDNSLKNLAERIGKVDLANQPGAGAAGGLGFGLMAFFGAQLKSGIELVMDVLNLRQRLMGADLCITAEGRLDAQSISGKAPVGVARLCRELGVPCIALAGGLGQHAELAYEQGLSAMIGITDRPMTLKEAMDEAPQLLARAAETVIRIWRAKSDSRLID